MKLALFDLDHTLLPIDSDNAWGRFCVARGWVDGGYFAARNQAFFEDYQKGCLDIQRYTSFATEVLLGKSVEQLERMRQAYFEAMIVPALRPQAHALVGEYAQRAGWTLLLITATNEFVVAPIAHALGFEHWLAVELERTAEGAWLNQVRGIPSMGQGKVDRLLQWLSARNKTWKDVTDSVMYSDSMNDVPLLSFVHQAVATNPDNALRTLARERGWKILQLFDEK